MPHPTQVFLHNRHALRVEFCLDDSRRLLCWSPHAGRSFAAADRDYSNRDDHLAVSDALPALHVWSNQALDVDLKTAQHDRVLAAEDRAPLVSHADANASTTLRFDARGPLVLSLRACSIRATS